MDIIENIFQWLLNGSIDNSISNEFSRFFIAVALVTAIMYGFIKLREGKNNDGNEELILIITAIIAIALTAIFKVAANNYYKEYYYQIILTILSGLVGGTFVLLSLNHQNKVSARELKRISDKNKEDEIKSVRPYLYLKFNRSGGTTEAKYDDIDRQAKRSIKFSLMNVGNGRAFEIKCNDMYNINIFNENEVLNVDESLFSKNLGVSFNLDELKEVNLRIDFKDVLDNKYYQEFNIEFLVPKIGDEKINIKKTLPKLIID